MLDLRDASAFVRHGHLPDGSLMYVTFSKRVTDEASVTNKRHPQLIGSLAVCVQLHVRNLFDDPLSIGSCKITPIHSQKKLGTQSR